MALKLIELTTPNRLKYTSLCAAAADELTEPALLAAVSLLLVEEGQILFVIFVGELFPANLFEGLLAAVTRGVNAQDTSLFSRLD
jgi:hypothetical protein